MSFISSTFLTASEALGFKYRQYSLNVTARFSDDVTPLISQKVKVYAKLWFFNISLGEYKTNSEGKFLLEYHWILFPFFSHHSLIFHIYDSSHQKILQEVQHSIPVTQKKKIERSIEIKAIFSNYASEFPKQQTSFSPYEPSYWERFKEKMSKPDPTPGYYRLLSQLTPIQHLDPDNQELNSKQYSESLQHKTIDAILAGEYPSIEPCSNKQTFQCKLNWTEGFNFPTRTIFLKKSDDGKFKIISIHTKNELVLPAEGAKFVNTLIDFNNELFAKRMLTYHMALHYEIGQFAIACRSLNDNPIGKLLAPHLTEISETNQEIEKLFPALFEKYHLEKKQVSSQINEVLAGLDFMDDVPLFIRESNTKLSSLWVEIGNFVHTFCKENESKIQAHWNEIFYMNKALIDHSLPKKVWDGRKKTNWLGDFGGEDTALTSITKNKEAPTKEDLDRLNRFIQYAIFRSLLRHAILSNVRENPRFSPNEDDLKAMQEKFDYQVASQLQAKLAPKPSDQERLKEILHRHTSPKRNVRGVVM